MISLFIQLQFDSDTPIYEQLKQQLIIGMAQQRLLPGERLPSVRELASDLGINLHTVNKAYKQLEEEGFLQVHRQRGAIVSPKGPEKADLKYRKALEEKLRPMIAEASLRQMSQTDIEEIIRNIYQELGGET